MGLLLHRIVRETDSDPFASNNGYMQVLVECLRSPEAAGVNHPEAKITERTVADIDARGPYRSLYQIVLVESHSGESGEYGARIYENLGTINPYDTLVDCGEFIDITGFNFIPNRNNFHGDYVSKGSMSVSLDGRKWDKVADFEFGNIINDPSLRYVGLAAPAKARYLRLDVLELVGDGDGFQSVDSDIEVL